MIDKKIKVVFFFQRKGCSATRSSSRAPGRSTGTPWLDSSRTSRRTPSSVTRMQQSLLPLRWRRWKPVEPSQQVNSLSCRSWTLNPNPGCGIGLEPHVIWREEGRSCHPSGWTTKSDRWVDWLLRGLADSPGEIQSYRAIFYVKLFSNFSIMTLSNFRGSN